MLIVGVRWLARLLDSCGSTIRKTQEACSFWDWIDAHGAFCYTGFVLKDDDLRMFILLLFVG